MEELDKSKSGNPMEGEARGKMSIEEFLAKDEQKDLLRFLTAGSVDDGKSTLIGRLLFDSKKLYEDQLDALERDSKRMGNAGEHIDYALLLDGLKAEREQGITIDVAYRYFSTNNRKFIIADTPGHEQYTRNMITGGSTANLAVILVDARTGVGFSMEMVHGDGQCLMCFLGNGTVGHGTCLKSFYNVVNTLNLIDGKRFFCKLEVQKSS